MANQQGTFELDSIKTVIQHIAALIMKRLEDIEVQRSEVRESKTRQIAVVGTKVTE